MNNVPGLSAVLSQSEPASADLRPTNVRWRIVGVTQLVEMLASLGKLGLGVTTKFMQDEFSFSNVTMGWVLSAFPLGYALFQVPAGWAGDRYGPRKVVTVTTLAYALFLAAMAVVPRLPMSRWVGLAWSFAVIQFLIAGATACRVPSGIKLTGSWWGRTGRFISEEVLVWIRRAKDTVATPAVTSCTTRRSVTNASRSASTPNVRWKISAFPSPATGFTR